MSVTVADPHPRSVSRTAAGTLRTSAAAGRELALALGLYFAYRQIRYLVRDDSVGAMDNAQRVVAFERRIGVFHELAVQRLVSTWHPAIELLNRYYVSVHFPATIAFLVWVWWRHRERYAPVRNWFAAVTAVALVVHVTFPLAPPRMLSDVGFVDTLARYGPNIYPADPHRSVANQFAAMPSLHFGWALMLAVCVMWIVGRRAWPVLLHPAITLLAIVGTANHYWLDAAVAAAIAGLTVVLWRGVTARRHGADDRMDDAAGDGADDAPPVAAESVDGRTQRSPVATDGRVRVHAEFTASGLAGCARRRDTGRHGGGAARPMCSLRGCSELP